MNTIRAEKSPEPRARTSQSIDIRRCCLEGGGAPPALRATARAAALLSGVDSRLRLGRAPPLEPGDPATPWPLADSASDACGLARQRSAPLQKYSRTREPGRTGNIMLCGSCRRRTQMRSAGHSRHGLLIDIRTARLSTCSACTMSLAVGRASGDWDRQLAMTSAMACGHSWGTLQQWRKII